MRVVVSRAALHGHEHYGVMVNDMARAYFNARIDRLLYCELPDEDKEPGKDLIGKSELCLYGRRDAAKGWQECLASHLVEMGFKRGTAHSCLFWHAEWELAAVVHGDDYVTSGPPDGLRKMQQAL